MARLDDIRKLLITHNRRLQVLKEQQARMGLDTSPAVVLEIEDIETQIDDLNAELKRIQNKDSRKLKHKKNITTQDLIRESLAKLITLDAISASTMDRILTLATDTETWVDHLTIIEAKLSSLAESVGAEASNSEREINNIIEEILWFDQAQEQQSNAEQLAAPPETKVGKQETTKPKVAPEMVDALSALPSNEKLPSLKEAFLRPPHLSAMLAEEVQLYQKIRSNQLSTSFNKAVLRVQKAYEYEEASHLAEDLVQQLSPEDLHPGLQLLDLRLQAVKHFLRLRKFAKLNALTSRWPELGRQLRDKISVLIELEAQAIQPQPLSEGTGIYKLWQQYGDDEALITFLRLYPLFGDISPDELNEYFAVSQAIATTTELTLETSEKAQTTPVSPKVEALGREVQSRYQNLIITYDKGDPAKNDEPIYQVQIIEPDRSPVNYKEHLLKNVKTFETSEGVTAQLRRLGENIYQFNFPAGVRQALLKVAQAERNTRVVLKLRAPELARLFWESLYIPTEPGMHLALSLKHSLVRFVDQPEGPTMPKLGSPLRVLLVLTSPENRPLSHLEREAAEITSVLRRLDPSNLRILLNQEGTLANLHQILVDFQPHVLHFTGLTRWSEAHKGVFVLRDGELPAEELVSLLYSQCPYLVVLNTVAPIDQEMGLVNALFRAGTLAIIATTGQVKYEAASLFARTLYTFLGDGYILEEAIVHARMALSRKEMNWSPYVLFTSSPATLNDFRLFSK